MASTTTTQLSLNRANGQATFRLGAPLNRPGREFRPGRPWAVEVSLGPDGVWSREVGHNALKITVQEGLAVVTFEGDREDHVLGPGETFRTPGRGRVALSAYQPSRFTVAAV